MASRVEVVVESGARRSFASALDWPGWSRGGPDETAALAALEAYRDRYAGVLRRAGLEAPLGALHVAERVPGDATTDFGAPSATAAADARALRGAQRAGLAAILSACWEALDAAVAAGPSLRPGPRGGGRSTEGIAAHVAEAELSYARGLGLSVKRTELGAPLRGRLLGLLAGTEQPERPPRWPLRYGVRRVAWHVTDHLFEIEDRAS